MNPISREFQHSIIRALRGILAAWDKWLKDLKD